MSDEFEVRHDTEPIDKLTELADVALTALGEDPAYEEGMSVVVMVGQGEEIGLVCRTASKGDAINLILSAAGGIAESEGGGMRVMPIDLGIDGPAGTALRAMLKAEMLKQQYSHADDDD